VHECKPLGQGSLSVVEEIAWPWALPTQIGIIIASLSQALQCLITAPSVLNAIAVDGRGNHTRQLFGLK
jgi:hypothetical protein